MLKKIGRSEFVLSLVGWLAAGYFRLVRATTRFTVERPVAPDAMEQNLPVIVAMWHGQHFMIPFAWPKDARGCALVSRSGDGEFNARVLERLGIEPVRGSGGSGDSDKIRKRGGVAALREMLRRLETGCSVALTADVPKIARVAGDGIVTLARMSGRPIYPIAVLTRRRYDFRSWDQASLSLPFGPGAMVYGAPIHVARDATPEECEAARKAVEAGLDAAHARAGALVGAPLPPFTVAPAERGA